MQTPTIILSIAGSDPSGGAGIQADIKTISALGGYAAAAITAITVQNTRGVTSVDYLPGPLVAAQTEAVLGDLHPAAVKIGMTGRTDIIVNLAACLSKYPDTPVVLDPVMLSSSGHPLMEPDATEALRTELFPRCRLVTPNLNEASFLLGKNLHTLQDMEQAATELSQHYGCAFLLKGGHLEGDRMTDVLFDGQTHFSSARINTSNLHGTGCTLSSAIATFLGQGNSLPEAVRLAKAYMNKTIKAASQWEIGSGYGPLCHFPPNLKL
mgnify:FL=1